ncbi:MAG TPA: tetratricopeptide repeat protein, partial [Gammaproteobacteria bacterium]
GRDKGSADEAPTIADLEARTVEIDTAEAISDSQTKAIESYRLFLDLASVDPELQAEGMRRLADLQLEAAEIEQLQQNLRALETDFYDAVQLYESLLETYPDYEKNDLVLYQLARAFEINGDPEAALATLDRLVDEFPNTPHYEEAQFRRGESLFVQRRYEEAEGAYAQVLQSGGEQFREQALYKRGWSFFKQQLVEESFAPFFRLLDTKLVTEADGEGVEAAWAGMGRAEQELVADSLRVLAIGFSYLDGPATITEFFDRHGKAPYAYVVYSSLGELYLDNERYQDTATAYRAFVEHDALHPKAPLMFVEAVNAYAQGGFADLVIEAKQDFVQRYGGQSRYWLANTFEQQPEVAAALKANLTELASHDHAVAQRTGDVLRYDAAARWYRDYLDTFPAATDAATKRFLLAEVLFESGRYRDAVAEYEHTAYGYAPHGQSGEAGYAALLAYSGHEQTLQGAALAEWHRQRIDSGLRFAATFPQHAQAATVMTDAAEMLFDLNDFSRAREAGRGMLDVFPAATLDLKRTAWTVVAHSSFDLGEFAAAEAGYSELLSLTPASAAERDELNERLASSIYKQGEEARAVGLNDVAVTHFLRVAEAVPGSEIVSTARYDAAAGLMQLEDWPRAIDVLIDFRSRYPNHDLASDVTTKLAVAYLSSGADLLAAGEFERIAEADGATEVRRDALWQAAELYEAAGEIVSAAGVFARYVEQYPEPVTEAIEVQYTLAELAREMDDYPARMRWLEEILDADTNAGEARTDRTRYLAAHAALELSVPTRDAFNAVRLEVPLSETLALKRERMERALSAYGTAAEYGVTEVTTAATYEIANLYHALSRDLFESERPSGLTPLELSQYEILLEEQAFPFEEQAIEIHEVNAARTAQGMYDEWVRKSLEALAELMPVRYAKQEAGERYVAAIR